MITREAASALCRDAAARIRRLAEAATPGPWRFHDTHLPLGGHTATILSGDGNEVELRAWLPTWSHEPWDEARNAWANAMHMAAWGPAPALSVAELLEYAADGIDALAKASPDEPLPALLSMCVRTAETFLCSWSQASGEDRS